MDKWVNGQNQGSIVTLFLFKMLANSMKFEGCICMDDNGICYVLLEGLPHKKMVRLYHYEVILQ